MWLDERKMLVYEILSYLSWVVSYWKKIIHTFLTILSFSLQDKQLTFSTIGWHAPDRAGNELSFAFFHAAIFPLVHRLECLEGKISKLSKIGNISPLLTSGDLTVNLHWGCAMLIWFPGLILISKCAALPQLRFGSGAERRMHVSEALISRLGLRTELQGHNGCVNCLEWNADGTWVCPMANLCVKLFFIQ